MRSHIHTHTHIESNTVAKLFLKDEKKERKEEKKNVYRMTLLAK